jgi:alkylation response protein AidB-like acyl-CoA dehydrogenase
MNAPAAPVSETETDLGIFAAIAARATTADAGRTTLTEDLRMLERSGLLSRMVAACLPGGDALEGVTLLRRLGRASLAVGRLVEGHLNAHKLIAVYARPDHRRRQVSSGFLGVWGADGTPPVRVLREKPGNRVVLSGSKRFCSGLGLLDAAVVLAATPEGALQMVLAEVSDSDRADAGDWNVSGMRATLSGRYDFEGVEGWRLGNPGDFLVEPHFEGGIWRYLALKTGAIEALAEAVRAAVLGRHGGDDARHRDRLLRAASAAHTARLWTEAAATAVEAPRAERSAVALPLAAREVVEEAARTALAVADRVLGTASFRVGSQVDLIRRDLTFYLRQADLDGKIDRAAETILAHQAPVGEQW